MADTAVVLLVLFFVFLFFVGLGFGIYFLYRWIREEEGTGSTTSKPVKPDGSQYSIRTLALSSNADRFYLVRDPNTPPEVFLDTLTGIRAGTSCNRVNWIYTRDKGLKVTDSELYLSDKVDDPVIGFDRLLLDSTPTVWNYDDTRKILCSSNGLCAQKTSISGLIGGVTTTKLTASEYDKLSPSDQVTYQWSFDTPITTSSTPKCETS